MEKHILLVDDDSDMLMLFERWLKKTYKVTTAASGREALDCIEGSRPNLVLLDYAMPELSGADTLREIRKNPDLAQLPVVFLTGMEETENEELRQLKPMGFWAKSMGKKNLLLAVEELFSAL